MSQEMPNGQALAKAVEQSSWARCRKDLYRTTA